MTSADAYTLACFFGALVSGARWLRVAQREHYVPLSATRFAIRWWTIGVSNRALAAIALGATDFGFWVPAA